MEPKQTSSSASSVFARALAAAHGSDPSSSSDNVVGANVGGFLVCLGMPEGTEFGVDYEVFRTGCKFQGVKFLPLGLHLVVFRAKEQEHGIRQGFFIRVTQHAQVLVREWRLDQEELGPKRPETDLENLTRAVLSFQLDSGLGAYPKQHYKTWHRLSRFISDTVLKRCGVELGALLLPGDCDDLTTSDEDQNMSESNVIPFFPDLPRTVRFTRLRKRKADLAPVERTTYHFDCSQLLEELISTAFNGSWQELMGEFQLSFVVFLQLSSLAALDQWKQFVSILCSCESALRARLPLFLAFLKVFRTHLEQLPSDFFHDEMTSENFLRASLQSLLELLEDEEMPRELRQKAFELRQWTSSHFQLPAEQWELDEYAPVVVSEEELYSSNASAPYLATAKEDEERRNQEIAASFLAAQRSASK